MKRLFTLLALWLIGHLTFGQSTMNIYQSNGSILQIPISSIDSITYTVGSSVQLATLTTLAVSNISNTSATCGGNIIAGTAISQRGVVWGTAPNPTLGSNQSNDGGGTGSFTSNLGGLTANTSYYVRAYAINGAGTAYGNEVSFTTTNMVGSIAGLDCSGATNSGILDQGAAAFGVTSVISYSGGISGPHSGQVVTSTGVTGLTATLNPGNFINGSGTLLYTITGTPPSGGLANFALNIGGQACTLSRLVLGEGIPIVSNPGAGVYFDGYNYPTIVLGNGQEWMAENLRTTVYANGDPIPNVPVGNNWASLNNGAWVHYDNDSQNETPYGKLYNWYAVSDPRNVCPVGWHPADGGEIAQLSEYLGGDASAGGKMKSLGTQYWLSPNSGATNESGFSGLPGGMRESNGNFATTGTYGYWWRSNSSNGIAAAISLRNTAGFCSWSDYNMKYGFSVRCLKD